MGGIESKISTHLIQISFHPGNNHRLTASSDISGIQLPGIIKILFLAYAFLVILSPE